MTLKFIGGDCFPTYTAESTDIVTGAIPHAVLVGKTVFIQDTGDWYIISEDGTLVSFALPSSFSGTISMGTVDIGVSAAGSDGVGNYISVLNAPGSVNSAPLATFPYGFNGATWDKIRVATVSKDLSTVALGSITTVWTPASGKKFRLMGGTISSSAAVSILFEDNAAGTTIFRTPKLLVDTPYDFVVNGGNGKLSGAADRVLKATSSGAANITGTIFGTEE